MSDQTKLFSKQKEKLIKIGTTYYFNKDDDVNTKSKYTCMISLDTFLSVCVITPLVISNWHGVWTLFDLHADFFPPYETYAFANCILICWTFIRQILHEWFDKLQDRYQNAYIWQVFIQVYIVHFNVMVNMQWRAVFIIFDIITGLKMTPAGASGDNDTMPVWVFTIISTIALIILRGLRNTLAVPFILALDHPTGVFHFPTRFRTQVIFYT